MTPPDPHWHRLPCGDSACPEWRRLDDGSVDIRSSERPTEVVRLSVREWAGLVAAIEAGEIE